MEQFKQRPKLLSYFLGLGVIILITSITVGLGLLCRYLLEFGEASNIYNFTIPNTLLHVGVFLALTGLTWIYAIFRKK